MHIPVSIGLVTQSGAALPLTLEGENATGPDERVLELTKPEQRFVFVDVAEAPLLSLGRHFSAPAIFKTPLDRKARAHLMKDDADSFNRWEAGQILATEILLEMANAAKSGAAPKTDQTYLDAIGEVLARADDDHAFAALMLMPPLEDELALAMSPTDPDAIHTARVALIRELAAAHGARLSALYKSLETTGHSSPDAESAGGRALRNACLRYLTSADDAAAAQSPMPIIAPPPT